MNKRRDMQLWLDGFTLDDMEQEAIAYLQEHEPQEGYAVGFSGGKDSLVTLDVVKRSGVKYAAHFSMSYIDPPEVLHFIRKNYPDVEWRRPKANIYQEIVRRGLPSGLHRWCCALIKESRKDAHVVTGVRAEESVRRAARPRTDFWKEHKIMMYKPIFAWKEWAVWEYLEKHGIAYPSLYDEGEGRIGCIVCPLSFSPTQASRIKIAKSMERYPGVWRAYKDAARKYFEIYRERKSYYKTFDELWDAFLVGFRSK